jgi:hypothetical protein
MGDTVYSYQIKTIECANCRAPLSGTISGSRFSCSFCGAAWSLTPRLSEVRHWPLSDQERLAGLWVQMETYHALAGQKRHEEARSQINQATTRFGLVAIVGFSRP